MSHQRLYTYRVCGSNSYRQSISMCGNWSQLLRLMKSLSCHRTAHQLTNFFGGPSILQHHTTDACLQWGRKVKAQQLPSAHYRGRRAQSKSKTASTRALKNDIFNWTISTENSLKKFESQSFTGHFRKLKSLISSKTLPINDNRSLNAQFEITMNSNWKLWTNIHNNINSHNDWSCRQDQTLIKWTEISTKHNIFSIQ